MRQAIKDIMLMHMDEINDRREMLRKKVYNDEFQYMLGEVCYDLSEIRNLYDSMLSALYRYGIQEEMEVTKTMSRIKASRRARTRDKVFSKIMSRSVVAFNTGEVEKKEVLS